MAFEELKENTENIQDQAKVYLESHLAYYKLWGFKVAMKSTTLIFKFVLILLPNSPQAGSDMLNNMVASFTASNQVGEMMKKNNKKIVKPKPIEPQSGYEDDIQPEVK